MEMFNTQKRRKSKHKIGETKVCKAEEVRKYFVNTKIENKVYLFTLFVVSISEIQKQFFADVLQNTCS